MNKPILQLHELIVGYPERPLSTPLNLQVPQGAILGIMGPNGTGKSTLMKTLLGLNPAFSGSVTWSPKTRFGYVPQEGGIDDLFPFTVKDLLIMGEKPALWRGLQKSDAQQIATILNELEMGGFESRLFRDLSSGQKQRTLLGRALMSQPDVLVLDEPFSSLDYSFRHRIWKRLKHWHLSSGGTLILIDHDINQLINEVSDLILMGPYQSFAGPKQELLQEGILQQAYEADLHFHHENGHIQVHFL